MAMEKSLILDHPDTPATSGKTLSMDVNTGKPSLKGVTMGGTRSVPKDVTFGGTKNKHNPSVSDPGKMTISNTGKPPLKGVTMGGTRSVPKDVTFGGTRGDRNPSVTDSGKTAMSNAGATSMSGRETIKKVGLNEQNRGVLSRENNNKTDKQILEKFDKNSPVAPNAGMFIVHYDPSVQLKGTSASGYDAKATQRDDVASLLRKNAKEMQNALDDYFGIDENDKTPRLLISHGVMISDKNAYCTVVYDGYESENKGEVAAAVSHELGNAVDSAVLKDWNPKPYPVTEGQLKREISLEDKRLARDKVFLVDAGMPKMNDGKSEISNGKAVHLNETFAPTEAVADKGMQFGG